MAGKPQPRVRNRPLNQAVYQRLLEQNTPELLARVAAARVPEGELATGDLSALIQPRLADLPHPQLLADCQTAAARLAQSISNREPIGILTDYDVDGITAHAVFFFALTEFFAYPAELITSLIGHRLEDGYGISDGLVDKILALPQSKQVGVIVSADCGSSDEPRIKRLAAAGIDVIVTDHHAIPNSGIPQSALAVLNPTRQDCSYPDSTIAGVMVAWLLMSALRGQLIEQGSLPADAPKLGQLLDFCALGTVADAVSLASPINRAVVNAGLQQLNRLQRPAWQAIHELLQKPNNASPFTIDDLGFQIGPRINARGRMSDPHAARRFLMASNAVDAMEALLVLDRDNQDRRKVERAMLRDIRNELERYEHSHSIVAFAENFHAGVQGIVASRLCEQSGKPTVVLSQSRDEAELTGSMRTIAGIHAREALQAIADNWPQVIVRFGGHAGAAGLTIVKEQLPVFTKAFNQVLQQQFAEQQPAPELLCDGELDATQLQLSQWEQLQQLQPYGRGWEKPLFTGQALIRGLRVIGSTQTHLSLNLELQDKSLRGVWFNALEHGAAALPVHDKQRVNLVYELAENEYNGQRSLQLLVRHAAPIE